MTAGGVKCWGANMTGGLGIGTNDGPDICYSNVALYEYACSSTPVDVVRLSGVFSAVSLGYGNACALSVSGDVSCWGINDWGQLGDGFDADPKSATTDSIPSFLAA